MSNNKILSILQSCDTIKELNFEFSKRFGWLKFKEKREVNKLKKSLITCIDSLSNDTWDIAYLRNMELVLISYYDKLRSYLTDVSILDYSLETNTFKPIYFADGPTNTVFILEIIGETIRFTIYDYGSNKSLEIVSENEVSSSQKKVESICKGKIINLLKAYLEDTITNGKSVEQRLINEVHSIYDIDEKYKDEIVPLSNIAFVEQKQVQKINLDATELNNSLSNNE